MTEQEFERLPGDERMRLWNEFWTLSDAELEALREHGPGERIVPMWLYFVAWLKDQQAQHPTAHSRCR